MSLRRANLPLVIITVTIIAVGASALLVACGDPKYQAPVIMVMFSAEFPPPAALATGATAGIAATVTNDSANAGVKFSCLPVAQCGTFSPSAIASSVPTTYQGPAAVPSGGTVTVTATSIADVAKSVSAKITID